MKGHQFKSWIFELREILSLLFLGSGSIIHSMEAVNQSALLGLLFKNLTLATRNVSRSVYDIVQEKVVSFLI